MNTYHANSTLAPAAVILGTLLGFSAPLAVAEHTTCFRTTDIMARACRADIIDDYNESLAKCINSEQVRSCKHEARQELKAAHGECREAAHGRDALCRRLPDAGPYIVDIDPDDFNGMCPQPDGQNSYYPLVIGTVTTFQNLEDEETIIVTVTDETREIEGVETIVVRDTVYDSLDMDDEGNPEGDRIEDTDDYYAIDNDCNIWYFGEISQNFEDGFLNNLDGSFIAGEEGAQAGIIMLGNPMVGDVYRQEFALGDAEDAGAVLDLAAELELANDSFSCDGDCLKTEDFVANEPDAVEFKYFKPGIGFVAEQLPGGDVVLELISVQNP
jgi:hypothetical protein